MKILITPNQLIKKLKSTDNISKNIKKWRKITSDIVNKKDSKLIVIVWPCSIHDTEEAIFYAKKLYKIRNNYPNLFLVMRCYLEKPRTNIGWKWFISDPNIDWSCDIEKGLKKSRKLLMAINEMGIPVSTEFLNNITPNYISDLITWWVIWARTTESQIHRELVSNLKCTIWYKNWTSWDIQIAIDAIKFSSNEHSFVWVNINWKTQIIKSTWNKNCHIILRWWKNWTNYDENNINDTISKLKVEKIKTWIMVDVSHANSQKNPENQPKVIERIASQIEIWNKEIIWVMIESNIFSGCQTFLPWKDNIKNLKYWVSMTDWCISFEETENVLSILNKAVEKRKTVTMN